MFSDDPAGPLRIVSMRDPAIDWHAMQQRGVTPLVYAETRDPESVIALPGKHPKWFGLRALTIGEEGVIDGMSTAEASAVCAFRHGVTEIHNFYGPDVALRPESPIPDGHGGTRLIWSDAGLEAVRNAIGRTVLYEIGGVIRARSAEGNEWGGGVLFALPPFLRPVLSRIERHLAELRKAHAGTASSEKPDSDNPSQSA